MSAPGVLTAAGAARINEIKKVSGIKDCDGFLTVAELEKATESVHEDSGCRYHRRATFCPVCRLFHYGYINESEVGGKRDWSGVKEQECDACCHLDGGSKKTIALVLEGVL